jgi:glutamyl-Q tRNA(Asp) synthetase
VSLNTNPQPLTADHSGRYRGRFAPSPTGPLHFGSLATAVASYLDARKLGGEWLLRIEDVDRTREVPGSADLIIRSLEAFGFEWTGPIIRQSDRTECYEAALEGLRRACLAYSCSCSRKAIASASPAITEADEPRYPGWCRSGPLNPGKPCAIRFRVDAGPIAFDDEIQGHHVIDVGAEAGDFVVKRRDGLFAYQLAVVVDDAEQRISHVVRGADLLTSTPRQILLQRALSLSTPKYAHVPLATDDRGVKLSKSAGAGAVDVTKPAEELWRTLQFLRQSPPAELRHARVETLWNWAVERWTTCPMKGLRQTAIVASSTVRSN